MPFGLKPSCHKCQTNVSDIWHKTNDGNALCSECFLGRMAASVKAEPFTKVIEKATSPEVKCPDDDPYNENVEVDDNINDEPNDDVKPRNEFGPGTRSGNTTSGVRGGRVGVKKTRGRSKKLANASKSSVGKGRGRRAVFKKQVQLLAEITWLFNKLNSSISYH